MVRTPRKDVALWANQVVAVIDEIATGHHAGSLLGLDGDVGGDVPFFPQVAKPTVAVAGVRSQRYRLQRETFQQPSNRFRLGITYQSNQGVL